MKTYPICLIGMEQRHAVIVGGGDVATRKVGDLLEAGARVTVISPALTSKLKALAETGQIDVVDRPYCEGDLSDAFLVIAATDNPAVNHSVWQEAEQRGCLVNAVDDPAHCNFITPAVVRRADVTIAISSGGSSPALARRLRERLETWVGPEYGELAALLAELRPILQSRYENEKDRQQAVYRLVDSDLAGIIKTKGVKEARVQAWEFLGWDAE